MKKYQLLILAILSAFLLFACEEESTKPTDDDDDNGGGGTGICKWEMYPYTLSRVDFNIDDTEFSYSFSYDGKNLRKIITEQSGYTQTGFEATYDRNSYFYKISFMTQYGQAIIDYIFDDNGKLDTMSYPTTSNHWLLEFDYDGDQYTGIKKSNYEYGGFTEYSNFNFVYAGKDVISVEEYAGDSKIRDLFYHYASKGLYQVIDSSYRYMYGVMKLKFENDSEERPLKVTFYNNEEAEDQYVFTYDDKGRIEKVVIQSPEGEYQYGSLDFTWKDGYSNIYQAAKFSPRAEMRSWFLPKEMQLYTFLLGELKYN